MLKKVIGDIFLQTLMINLLIQQSQKIKMDRKWLSPAQLENLKNSNANSQILYSYIKRMQSLLVQYDKETVFLNHQVLELLHQRDKTTESSRVRLQTEAGQKFSGKKPIVQQTLVQQKVNVSRKSRQNLEEVSRKNRQNLEEKSKQKFDSVAKSRKYYKYLDSSPENNDVEKTKLGQNFTKDVSKFAEQKIIKQSQEPIEEQKSNIIKQEGQQIAKPLIVVNRLPYMKKSESSIVGSPQKKQSPNTMFRTEGRKSRKSDSGSKSKIEVTLSVKKSSIKKEVEGEDQRSDLLEKRGSMKMAESLLKFDQSVVYYKNTKQKQKQKQREREREQRERQRIQTVKRKQETKTLEKLSQVQKNMEKIIELSKSENGKINGEKGELQKQSSRVQRDKQKIEQKIICRGSDLDPKKLDKNATIQRNVNQFKIQEKQILQTHQIQRETQKQITFGRNINTQTKEKFSTSFSNSQNQQRPSGKFQWIKDHFPATKLVTETGVNTEVLDRLADNQKYTPSIFKSRSFSQHRIQPSEKISQTSKGQRIQKQRSVEKKKFINIVSSESKKGNNKNKFVFI